MFSRDPESDPRVGDLLVPLQAAPADALTVVIIGVPQHIGVERNGGRPGAADAPSAIRQQLFKLATSAVIDVVRHGHLAIVDGGDIATDGKTLEQIHDQQEDVVYRHLANDRIPIILGGGHDTAWPTLRALDRRSIPYGVVNIDAHADVRPLLDGFRAHSGSPFYQMLTSATTALAPGAFVEFGLQHHAVAKAHLDMLDQHDATVLMLDDVRRRGLTAAWDRAMAVLTSTGNAYISLDMDAFASAFAPGVSAPAADGFAPHEIALCLRQAGRNATLKAFDVVEMNPGFDIDNRTAKLAAVMIMEVLAGIAERLRSR